MIIVFSFLLTHLERRLDEFANDIRHDMENCAFFLTLIPSLRLDVFPNQVLRHLDACTHARTQGVSEQWHMKAVVLITGSLLYVRGR
jgi:hypothetical protein